jgi:polyhydroxyalkanoate synthase
MDMKQDAQAKDQSPAPQVTEHSPPAPAKAEGNGAAAPAKPAKKAKAPAAPQPPPQIDIEKFATNIAKVVEEGGKAFAAWLKPRAEGKVKEPHEQVADIVKTLGRVAEYWMTDPRRTVELQTNLSKAYLDLWSNAVRRMTGEQVEPVAKADPRDRRFADPEWSTNQYFDFLKQAYLVTSHWADHIVAEAKGLDSHTKRKADFYVKQLVNAIAPSNFLFTNPELLRLTLSSNAENLARGMKMLAEDIEAGGGELRIRQSDHSQFEVGRNIAVTPGKIVYQNELMQLIQYTPTTENVLKMPLLIVPPWINKYYILDLNEEKSFIKWVVSQGVTVFVISWINPDARLSTKTFADYMHQGPIEALDKVLEITGEPKAHTIGYCVGGTMLAVMMAYLADKGGLDKIASATMFTAQVDFEHGGDLTLFTAEPAQVEAIERRMAELGYLEGKKMATVFNFLRSNDLVWPYIISNYLKGEQPFPFDLLYWNSDSTRMPAANHSYYLRNCYMENKLSKGEMVLDGVRLDLKKVTTPICNVATREDHIAPAKSVLIGCKFFGGPVDFLLAGSGHIAGIVNPPAGGKYQYWVGPKPDGYDNPEVWLKQATETKGSWWPYWVEWIKNFDRSEVPARQPGSNPNFPVIEDAPGAYVKMRD